MYNESCIYLIKVIAITYNKYNCIIPKEFASDNILV